MNAERREHKIEGAAQTWMLQNGWLGRLKLNDGREQPGFIWSSSVFTYGWRSCGRKSLRAWCDAQARMQLIKSFKNTELAGNLRGIPREQRHPIGRGHTNAVSLTKSVAFQSLIVHHRWCGRSKRPD